MHHYRRITSIIVHQREKMIVDGITYVKVSNFFSFFKLSIFRFFLCRSFSLFTRMVSSGFQGVQDWDIFSSHCLIQGWTRAVKNWRRMWVHTSRIDRGGNNSELMPSIHSLDATYVATVYTYTLQNAETHGLDWPARNEIARHRMT